MDNSFDAMNRMIELGMGVSLAQQMMRTMTECMQGAPVPAVSLSAPAMPAVPQVQYYAVINESVSGPYGESELIELAKSNQLTSDTYVWANGMSAWVQAKKVPEVNKAIILSGNGI